MNKDEEINDVYAKEFADRVRLLRNQRKISAREMSLELGQNVNYINLIENQKRFPSLQGFFAICKCLSVSPHDFFDFCPAEDIQKNESAGQTKAELNKIIAELDDEQRSSLLKLICSLRK